MTPSKGASYSVLLSTSVTRRKVGGVLADMSLRRILVGLGLRQLCLRLPQLRRGGIEGCFLGIVVGLGDQLLVVERLVAFVIELGAFVLGLA